MKQTLFAVIALLLTPCPRVLAQARTQAAASPVPPSTSAAWSQSASAIKAEAKSKASSAAVVGPAAKQLDSAAAGTSTLANRFLGEKVRLTPEQQARVTHALSSAAAARKAAEERGTADAADIERLQQAERELTLVYWESPAAADPGSLVLAPHQAGYVFENGLEALQQSLYTPAYASARDLAPAVRAGLENARVLTSQPDLPPSAELQGLLQTFDWLRQDPRVLASEAGHQSFLDIQFDLGAQIRSAKGGVEVTVKTLKPDSQEVTGYIIRYELKANYIMGRLKNTSFDLPSRAKGRLGPFRYYFWAEKPGQTPTPPGPQSPGPRLVDLGGEGTEREIAVFVSP